MTNMFKILMYASMLMLAGCSFNPVGESSFECNRKDKPSEYCRSFKALEKSTNGNLPESRFDKEFKMSEYDRATGIAPDSRDEKKVEISTTNSLGLLPHNINQNGDILAGAPVRQAPIIQRAWIKRFTDENDALHGDVIVYKEIKRSKWSGFDMAPNVVVGQSNIYPHKVKESQSTPDDPRHGSPAPNFSQPESNFEESVETATSPAVSGDN